MSYYLSLSVGLPHYVPLPQSLRNADSLIFRARQGEHVIANGRSSSRVLSRLFLLGGPSGGEPDV